MGKMKWNKIIIYSFLFTGALIGGAYFYIFEFDYLFEPDPIGIELEEGKNLSLDFKVTLSCVYNVGISFNTEHGAHENIYKTFVDKRSKRNLPASIDIIILNSDKEVIFKRIDFGGKKLSVRYGPNPIKFMAGHIYLPSGKYNVKIRINELRKDFSDFEAHFFVANPPKIKCI